MRLTDVHRQAFVKAVMDDVPKVDYPSLLEKIVAEDMRQHLPAPVVALMRDAKLKGYLAWGRCHWTVHTSDKLEWETLGAPRIEGYKLSKGAEEKCNALIADAGAQLEQRKEMQNKLRAAIKGCKTRKQAVDTFPELEKYLPAGDEPTTQNLPAIANLVADLAKAGWPKGKVPA